MQTSVLLILKTKPRSWSKYVLGVAYKLVHYWRYLVDLRV